MTTTAEWTPPSKRSVLFAFLLLNAANVFDTGMTLAGNSSGFMEANPFMAALLSLGTPAFIGLKLGFVLLVSAMLAYHADGDRGVWRTLRAFMWVYLILVAYQFLFLVPFLS